MGLPLGAITGGLQALGGLVQTFTSGVKKKEKALEALADSYKPNEGIVDYYNKALAKYDPNPYTSQSYLNDTNKIQRNLGTGLAASQDRRGGLGTLSTLVQGANDAGANAASRAENQQNQALSQLGNAARVKAQEDFKPFEMKYNLLAAQAGAAAKQKAQGLQNFYGGLASMAASKNTNVPKETFDMTGIRYN